MYSEIVKDGKFKQLFISTHSLDFLKYLKRIIPKDTNGKHLERRYFVIERDSSGSQIKVMPKYLKAYVTEFNYLFHQIHKCANADAANGTMGPVIDKFITPDIFAAWQKRVASTYLGLFTT